MSVETETITELQNAFSNLIEENFFPELNEEPLFPETHEEIFS